jgi:NADPH:quinone reductase-like Zn-dependent oxidoreductase
VRAIVQSGYGPPEQVLRVAQVPTPVAGPGQVLVRVRATSVHADVWHAVTGIPLVLRLMGSGVREPRTPIPGTDLAGEVVSLGAGVTGLAVGQRVLGEVTPTNQWRNAGTFAEYVDVAADTLAPMPAGLTFEQAAAVPTSALIALTNLRDQGGVRAGDRVLVNGAGGSVGVFAVQLATAFGAEVTAVDSAAKLPMLRSLGADHVIDYAEQDFTDAGIRYDIVFDVVSDRPFRQVRRALAPDGRFVLIGHDRYGASGHSWVGSLGRMLPMMAVSPFVRQLPGIRPTPPRAENLATIVGLLESDAIRPVLDQRTFRLEDAAEALAYLTRGTATGRVVLSVADGQPTD